MPVRPGIRYTTMPTEAAAMTTMKNALVTRLSLCRKRIMDGLGPSTLYAHASWTRPSVARRLQAEIRLNAQLSRNCCWRDSLQL